MCFGGVFFENNKIMKKNIKIVRLNKKINLRKKRLRLVKKIKHNSILIQKRILQRYKRKVRIKSILRKKSIKILKYLNYKYRVKFKGNEVSKKNRFMKINQKRENEKKPHFLMLNTSESNCHINLTDSRGNTKFVRSCGHLGFKGSKRSSKFAIERLAIDVASKIEKYRLLNILVKLKGYSKKNRVIFRLFKKINRRFKGITEFSVAHNGCRLKKITRK